MTNISYFKTQWWRILTALICLVIAGCFFFQPVVGQSTSESLRESIGAFVLGLIWFSFFVFWFIMSFVSYNEDCIRELNKRVTQLENRAITEIDTLKPNHFMVKRRLGPDKDT